MECFTIKPLEWVGDGHWHSGDNEGWMEEAETPFGWGYAVEFGTVETGPWILTSTFGETLTGFGHPEAAKAAAQADYEARILSAITIQPAAQAQAEAKAMPNRRAYKVGYAVGAASRQVEMDAMLEAKDQAQAEAVAVAYLACRDAIADYPRQSPDYDEWTRYDEQIAHAQDCIDTLTPADAQAALARIKAEVRKATLREAARKATSFLVGDPENGIPLRNPMAHEIETAILALIDKEPGNE